jgi:hypothetical protein
MYFNYIAQVTQTSVSPQSSHGDSQSTNAVVPTIAVLGLPSLVAVGIILYRRHCRTTLRRNVAFLERMWLVSPYERSSGN